MRITRLKTQLVKLPLEHAITTSIHAIESVGCVCVSLETDQGLVGESYVFTINAARLKAFDEMIQGFEHRLVNEDPHFVERIGQQIWQDLNPTGHKGVTIAALSAIDTACWDLVGKAADQPLHKIFGACRDRIRTYASGGLWLSQSIDELVTEATGFVEAGFRAMKIRVGSASPADDVERVRAVRTAVGTNIGLMADVNQALRPKQALALCRKLQCFELEWVEEPVLYNDLKGQAYVRQHSPIDIAAGETEYSRFGMMDLLRANACDVLMPDLQRVGGLSDMLKTAALAEAHHTPVSTHIFTEHSLCAAGAMSNCVSVEHMPWFATLFNEQLALEDGDLLIPTRPGTGFTFSQTALKKYKI